MKSFSGIALVVGLLLPIGRGKEISEPISLDADVDWYGNDGTWSAVNVFIGSQLKTISLFPSTIDRSTWVLAGSACDNSPVVECFKKRGGLYWTSESTTWNSQGQQPSSRDPSVQATYGSDTIYVDYIPVNESPVVISDDTDTWIGLLGLGVSRSGHDIDTHINPSLMEIAYVNDSFVPSSSYGYTAGAHYRLKGTPASLTIGGVDRARFHENNATFHLTRSAVPVVSLNTIAISSGTEGAESTGIIDQFVPSSPGESALYTLDSSTSYLWLPKDAFDAFGQVFNLTYNDTLGVYTYGNDTSHRERLLAMNISITFSISDLPDSSHSVNITLPFQAFDHSLTYPYTNTPVPYLPVKRATTNQEQRIGRVFFQEAYLTVDYERWQFSVCQAKFGANLVSTNDTDIVRIDSYLNNKISHTLIDDRKRSNATKMGIGIGAAIGGILVIGVAVYIYIRKRRVASCEQGEKLADTGSNSDSGAPAPAPAELHGNSEHGPEMASDTSHVIFELPAFGPAELDAGPVYFAEGNENKRSSRYSDTLSSIPASLSSKVTESSDEDDPAALTGHDGPPKYTPQK
ncbi:aspartic peptidase domain-containing protein [Aspergillus coremiiformis]|uniref:Aspartic peptidase domain-containing protein n=1 Tax=Aspergillus coremiiformis TaxID=138285 RepID=A0A5N6Z891_9EURO|nr:aspartic peptidase domain-containing protein [Aspergillus coremiiformis]